jgi:hypothetical protein
LRVDGDRGGTGPGPLTLMACEGDGRQIDRRGTIVTPRPRGARPRR